MHYRWYDSCCDEAHCVSEMKLLVVEDDVASLELMTAVFVSLKAEVRPLAHSPEAALLVNQENFDGIFLDPPRNAWSRWFPACSEDSQIFLEQANPHHYRYRTGPARYDARVLRQWCDLLPSETGRHQLFMQRSEPEHFFHSLALSKYPNGSAAALHQGCKAAPIRWQCRPGVRHSQVGHVHPKDIALLREADSIRHLGGGSRVNQVREAATGITESPRGHSCRQIACIGTLKHIHNQRGSGRHCDVEVRLVRIDSWIQHHAGPRLLACYVVGEWLIVGGNVRGG